MCLHEGAHGWLADAQLRLLRVEVSLEASKAASGWGHAFVPLAVSHASPVVIGSGCLAGLLPPAFLGCLPALPMAPGTTSHCC